MRYSRKKKEKKRNKKTKRVVVGARIQKNTKSSKGTSKNSNMRQGTVRIHNPVTKERPKPNNAGRKHMEESEWRTTNPGCRRLTTENTWGTIEKERGWGKKNPLREHHLHRGFERGGKTRNDSLALGINSDLSQEKRK